MNDLKLALKLRYDGQAVTAGTRANVQDIRQLEQSTQRAGRAAEQHAQRMATADRRTRENGIAAQAAAKQNRALAHSYTLVAGAVSGFLALNTATNLVNSVAQVQQLNVRLQSLTVTSERYAATQQYLFDLAGEHNKRYLTLADSYARLLALQKAGIVTQIEGRKILEGMSNAASELGASNAQLEQTMFGMAQGFTAGTLRAEELNQVTEPLPGLMQALDKASGQAAGGFRRMVNAGQVTSQMFKQVLIKALEEYEGAAVRMANTVPGGLARVQTAYDQLVQRIEQPVNNALVPALDATAAGLSALSENTDTLDTLATGATALALVFGGRLASSVAVSTKKLVAKTVASQAAIREDLRLAAAEQAVATSARQRAIQEQAAATRALANAQTTYARTRAIRNLAVANSQAAVSERALAAATNTHTLAAQRANLAVRALKGTMALLGGPAGIALLAAYGIYQFATRADDATAAVKKLNSESENFNPFANYTKDHAQRALALYEGQLETAEQLAEEAQQRFDNTFLKGTRADIDAANAKIEELINKIAALRHILGQSEPQPEQTSGQSSKQTELFDRDNAALARRLALMGKTNELDKVNFEIRAGAYRNLLPAQQQSLQLLAGEIDKRNEAETVTALEQSLLTKEQRIQESYRRRLSIAKTSLDAEGQDKARYDAIQAQLQQQRDEQLAQLHQQADDEAKQRKINARQLADQQRRDAWDQELAELQGFHSRKEAEEAAHQDRNRGLALRNAGEYGSVVQQFVDYDRASGADRLAIATKIGGQLTAKMAQHSKKAFALNKAMNIAQATMQTYLAATKALAELGPIAGPVAAGVITAMGVANVAMIAKQQPPAGIAHGGLGYVPKEATYLLDKGERVLSPRQNRDMTEAAARINKGSAVGAGVNIVNNINIDATGAAPGVETNVTEAMQTASDQLRAELAEDFSNNGPLAQTLRASAA